MFDLNNKITWKGHNVTQNDFTEVLSKHCCGLRRQKCQHTVDKVSQELK